MQDQIAVYHSSNGNKIYDNKINGGEVGIRINTNSTSNLIYNNSLFNSKYGIFLLQGASSNLIDSNTISNTSRVALYVKGPTTSNNVFKNNHLLNNQNDEIGRSNLGNSTVIFMNNTIDNTR